MSNGTPRICGYVRVSTDKQSLGPDAQRAAILQCVQAAGLDPEQVYWYQDASSKEGDESVSGSVEIAARKAGGQMCRDVQRGDYIMFAKLDRGFRSISDFCFQMDAWERIGVHVYLADMGPGFDYNSPAGRLMLHMLAGFAQFERDLISTRIKEALAARKRRGVPYQGKNPGWGFKWAEQRVWSEKHQQWLKVRESDTDERHIMGQFHRWTEEGWSFEDIANHLNDLGHKPKRGKRWNWQSVRRAYKAECALRIREISR